jgi:hypothetical protein
VASHSLSSPDPTTPGEPGAPPEAVSAEAAVDSATPNSATPIHEPDPGVARSRRVLLAAAAGGIGAWVAGAALGGSQVEAAAGSALIMGKTTNSAGTRKTRLTAATTGPAFEVQQKGVGVGVHGYASATTGPTQGVVGRSVSPGGDGVLGVNTGAAGTGAGVHAEGGHNPGLVAKSTDSDGVLGTNTGAAGAGAGVHAEGGHNPGVVANSTDGLGIHATGGYSGIQANGGLYGSISEGTSIGAYSSGADYALYGIGGLYGAYGTGSAYGVYGAGPTGVVGNGTTYGVIGTTTDPNADGVRGDGGQWGVHGVNGRSAGVRGDAGYVGVWGQAGTYGVYGYTTGTTSGSFGVMGQATGSAWALYGIGNVGVQGTLSKLAGSFRIDHPLDPERRWLSHSFVESPDMMNVYNGVADLDADGRATVGLPDYFGALNRDFRYQLTAIGSASPALHIAEEVRDNAFSIAGGTPNGRVSWQVTGIRQDDYAKAHPIVVELDKDADEHGTRLFVPKGSKSRQWLPHPVRTGGEQPATPTDQPKVIHPKQG